MLTRIRSCIRIILGGVHDGVVWPFYWGSQAVRRVKRLLRREYVSPRSRAVRFDVQPGVHLSVFWKEVVNGVGPGIALVVAEEEVLRFDCFGAGVGHYHVEPARRTGLVGEFASRLWLAEKDVEAQIDRAAFELTANVVAHVCRNANPLVRATRIDRERMAVAVEQGKAVMLQYHLQHSAPRRLAFNGESKTA